MRFSGDGNHDYGNNGGGNHDHGNLDYCNNGDGNELYLNLVFEPLKGSGVSG